MAAHEINGKPGQKAGWVTRPRTTTGAAVERYQLIQKHFSSGHQHFDHLVFDRLTSGSHTVNDTNRAGLLRGWIAAQASLMQASSKAAP
jgi:hypothetical protein